MQRSSTPETEAGEALRQERLQGRDPRQGGHLGAPGLRGGARPDRPLGGRHRHRRWPPRGTRDAGGTQVGGTARGPHLAQDQGGDGQRPVPHHRGARGHLRHHHLRQRARVLGPRAGLQGHRQRRLLRATPPQLGARASTNTPTACSASTSRNRCHSTRSQTSKSSGPSPESTTDPASASNSEPQSKSCKTPSILAKLRSHRALHFRLECRKYFKKYSAIPRGEPSVTFSGRHSPYATANKVSHCIQKWGI